MATIAIIGPGAIGGLVAAWLAGTGRHEVTVCARTVPPVWKVETPSGDVPFPPRIVTEPAKAGVVADWVIVATKAYDAAGAATWFPHLGTKARIAILQNGVEHRERFAEFVDPNRIVPVVTDLPSERPAPGHVKQRGRALLHAVDDAAGREFRALFGGTPVEVNLTKDFKTAAWRKLCINSAGVLSAIALQPARIMNSPIVAATARELVMECIAVGRAEGAVLEDAIADAVIAQYRNGPPDAVNSLHADRAAGRRTEIDARNGVIVRLGRKHGIQTPCNRMAVALFEAASS